MKIAVSHIDTCLPDYWGGHAKAHMSVAVHKNMTAERLRKDLVFEVDLGVIMGNDERFQEPVGPETLKALYDAIAEMHIFAGPLFTNLEENEDGESVRAYFIIDVKE